MIMLLIIELCFVLFFVFLYKSQGTNDGTNYFEIFRKRGYNSMRNTYMKISFLPPRKGNAIDQHVMYFQYN